MADLSNGSGVFQTYNNSGTGVAELGDNKSVKSGQGIAGRTRVINLAKTNMTSAELEAAIKYLSAGDVAGTNDAHTVVAVQPLTESGVFTTGVTDAVQVVIQGTGAFTAASNFGTGSTGITSTVLAEFSGLQA
jgi:hypothetical protein|tara:strand:- start:7163 stop:7561 length:399 start_codon:yes stop_codon:yes gene_type:complete